MTTPADVAVLRATVQDLTATTLATVYDVVAATPMASPAVARAALEATLPAVLAPSLEAGTAIGATWYEEVTALGWPATTINPVVDSQIHGIIRWASGLPFRTSTNPYPLSLYPSLAGAVQRLTAGSVRDTIMRNIVDDYQKRKVDVRYARSPQSGACAFCVMLASRGAVYLDQMNAEVVIGRGMEPQIITVRRSDHGTSYRQLRGDGVSPRGRRQLTDGYHDFCRCEAVPVMGDDPVPYDLERYEAMWKDSPSLGALRANFTLR